LSGVSAAVAGVIANLAAWFALQTLFGVTGEVRYGPVRLHTVELGSIDLFAVGLAIASYLALTRLRLGLLPTLALSAGAGFVYYLVTRGF
jgi:chromate transporter